MNSHANPSAAARPAAAGRSSTWIALLVAVAFFMENLDGTVITTAVPQMAASFGVQPVDLDIGISAYLLALGVFIPCSGWVSERLGARTVFTAAMAVFTVSSLLCGFAQELSQFVALRVLQGVGGAMMVPVGRLVVLNSTPKEKLINAIATLTWPALVAPVLGPPVGGFITTYASWRWIFYLNLPIGLAAMAAALALIPNDRAAVRRPFDWPGFLLGGTALFSLLWAVEQVGGAQAAWGRAALFFALGAALLAGCVVHLRRAANPMIDLSVLKVPTFVVTIAGGSLFRMTVGATAFLLPVMFQAGFGLDAFHAGLLMIAIFGGNLVIKPATTPLLRRFGFRRVLLVNGVLNAAALLTYACMSPATPVPLIATLLFIGGVSRSIHFTGLNTLAFADVPDNRMRPANTLFSTAFQLMMGMGVALGALAARGAHWLNGLTGMDALPAMDYRLAFVVLAVLSLLSLADAWRLPPDAGDHVARRRAR
ncbi:MFS transporter [Pigmentiphaga soli]|uniref:MFS transporter n=1 Tax=Pigmentiphaga soli TaxID=1007095 RepID=A0ABP8GKA1_9BURK